MTHISGLATDAKPLPGMDTHRKSPMKRPVSPPNIPLSFTGSLHAAAEARRRTFASTGPSSAPGIPRRLRAAVPEADWRILVVAEGNS